MLRARSTRWISRIRWQRRAVRRRRCGASGVAARGDVTGIRPVRWWRCRQGGRRRRKCRGPADQRGGATGLLGVPQRTVDPHQADQTGRSGGGKPRTRPARRAKYICRRIEALTFGGAARSAKLALPIRTGVSSPVAAVRPGCPARAHRGQQRSRRGQSAARRWHATRRDRNGAAICAGRAYTGTATPRSPPTFRDPMVLTEDTTAAGEGVLREGVGPAGTAPSFAPLRGGSVQVGDELAVDAHTPGSLFCSIRDTCFVIHS